MFEAFEAVILSEDRGDVGGGDGPKNYIGLANIFVHVRSER